VSIVNCLLVEVGSSDRAAPGDDPVADAATALARTNVTRRAKVDGLEERS
jgi:hypothetical protein